MTHEIELTGIDGGNPLGFLAALGTIRTLSLAWPAADVLMSWRVSGLWRPVLHTDRAMDQAGVVESLHAQLMQMASHPAFMLADNLNVPAEAFAEFARQAQTQALAGDRRWADFVAAFGCEATTETDSKKQQVIRDTQLRTMSGAGHQHFLGTMRHIVGNTRPEHLQKALFCSWRYDDPVEKQTMRWDPIDDVRYALRWRNPSGDPSRKKRGSMLGANRLAIEGLPLLPTMPAGRSLRTTAFRGGGRRDTFWTWPIWDVPLPIDPIRSILALAELQKDEPAREKLAPMGIVEVFRSQRLTVGKFRNFAPANTV